MQQGLPAKENMAITYVDALDRAIEILKSGRMFPHSGDPQCLGKLLQLRAVHDRILIRNRQTYKSVVINHNIKPNRGLKEKTKLAPRRIE